MEDHEIQKEISFGGSYFEYGNSEEFDSIYNDNEISTSLCDLCNGSEVHKQLGIQSDHDEEAGFLYLRSTSDSSSKLLNRASQVLKNLSPLKIEFDFKDNIITYPYHNGGGFSFSRYTIWKLVFYSLLNAFLKGSRISQ
jgi:hypothetical protein